MTKVCTKCGVEKELSEYGKKKSGKNGIASKCKSCYKEYYKEYNKNNKEHIKENRKEYRKNNKEYYKEYKKKHIIKINKENYNANTCTPQDKPIIDMLLKTRDMKKQLKTLKKA